LSLDHVFVGVDSSVRVSIAAATVAAKVAGVVGFVIVVADSDQRSCGFGRPEEEEVLVAVLAVVAVLVVLVVVAVLAVSGGGWRRWWRWWQRRWRWASEKMWHISGCRWGDADEEVVLVGPDCDYRDPLVRRL
jgi:hypothetical protein